MPTMTGATSRRPPVPRSRVLDPDSRGYQHAKMTLMLHFSYSTRSFLRVDSVQSLQNDRGLAELCHRCEGKSMRDAWFYPYPQDDVDTVLKDGFKNHKGQLRFGLYFVPRQLPVGKSPTLKMVLCKVCVGNSVCRTEDDVENISRPLAGYESAYVPGGADSIFNDTYVLNDNTLAVPTHVVTYHLDVSNVSPEDHDLITWVNDQCTELLGFTEANLTKFLITTTQSCESIGALRSRLRSQADLPAAVAARLAADLFERIPRDGQPIAVDVSAPNAVPEAELHRVAAMLGVCEPAPAHGPPMPPPEHVINQAFSRMEDLMQETGDMEEELVALADELSAAGAQFDQDHFERAACFKADLVSHMKDYMLTLQVAEERKQQLERSVQDATILHEFFDQQRNTVTKVAMLTQWGHLMAQRVDLKHRLNALEGMSTMGPSCPEVIESEEVAAMQNKVAHKDRIVDLLVKRLRTCGTRLTPREEELLALCA